jgi:hypothetical protein
MELSKLIIPSKTVWVDYPGLSGFQVQLAHLTRDELMKIRKKALNTKVNRKTRAMEEEVDSDLFQSLYIQAVIKDWKGLKYKYLPKLVPTDISSQDPDEELEYSEDNAEVLMKNAADFDSWVSAMLEDIENFTVSS